MRVVDASVEIGVVARDMAVAMSLQAGRASA